MTGLLVLAAVVVLLGLRIELRSRFRHGWHRLAWRWLSGRAWHGREIAHDHASWPWPGRWFWRLHRAKRAAVRAPVTVLVLSAAPAYAEFPQVTLYVLLALALSGVALSIGMTVRLAFGWRHHRRWVRPAMRALAAKHDLDVRPLVARDRCQIRLALPQAFAFDAKERQALVQTLTERIGIESPEATWRLAGPAPMLTLTVSSPPPAQVRLDQIRAAIDRAKPDELVWGIGKQGAVVKSSLSGDSPHIGLSMGSGAGKSVTARAIAATMLYRGANVLILDYKMISHQWARDLPNVAIVRRPHEIHEALLWLGAEAERRNEVALAGADMDGNVHAVVGARLVVICEELNATMSKLRAHWRQLRNDDRSLPQRSPALEAIDAVNLMGRQILMNLVYMGQRLSVKAIGGDGDARESIGVIGFGRYSASNWKMLAGDYAMPPKSLTPGRIQVVSDQVREVQAVFMSAAEARDLALGGTVTPCPAGMPGAVSRTTELVPLSGADLPVVSGTVLTHGGLVTLSEAVDQGFVKRSLYAVRKASQRDPEFPSPEGLRSTAKLYDAIDLMAWDES